jgi:hypothetical protein
MKYLKGFNESISSNEVIENLKDICRDLEDMNFEVDVWYNEDLSSARFWNEYNITINKGNRKTWWTQENKKSDKKIIDNEQYLYGSVQQHFENYMRELGYNMKTKHLHDGTDTYIKYVFLKTKSKLYN